jgi:hypothetical protein
MATLLFSGLRKFYHGAAPIDEKLFHHEGPARQSRNQNRKISRKERKVRKEN